MYKVYLVIQGQVYEAKEPAGKDLAAAKALADQYHAVSGQETIVKDLTSNKVVYHGAATPSSLGDKQAHLIGPPMGAPQSYTVLSEDEIREIKRRETVPLDKSYFISGAVVLHNSSRNPYVFVCPDPSDPHRLVFMDLRTGKMEPSVPPAIAEGLYVLVVPKFSDLSSLLPHYPKEVFSAIYQEHGDPYKDEEEEGEPAAPKVVDTTATSRREVGKAAAQRKAEAPEHHERFLVEYLQKNWVHSRFFEKTYKTEYQATRRAEKMLESLEVRWSAVVDSAKGERILVFPPGFDPDASTEPPETSDITYRLEVLDDTNTWALYEKEYKSMAPAQKRAARMVTGPTGFNVIKVIEYPSEEVIFQATREGYATEEEEVPPPTPLSTDALPTPPAPEKPPQTPEERLRALEAIAKPEPRDARRRVQEELPLAVARKIISLACVSVVSKYNVSMAEATVICKENVEWLDELAQALATSEIDVYSAIQKMDFHLAETYNLVDLSQPPVTPTVKAEGGEVSDLGPMIERAVEAKLTNISNQRAVFLSQKTASVTRDEVEEVAFELAFGKRKRATGKRSDVTLYWSGINQDVADQVWDDHGIVIDMDEADELQGESRFYLAVTTVGYVLSQETGKTFPGKGFMKFVKSLRSQYGCRIILVEDKDRVDLQYLV
ncbi:MAG: hypothetical protein WCR85_00085 [Sphaerochaeta sp.]